MANINSKCLFITTSPRTPEKMIPEIRLLHDNFEGKEWNDETQRNYMELLRDEACFNGSGVKDPAFSARDRITRAPQSLGFVSLSPTIHLTQAGAALLSSRRVEDVFLRQLLKFQIPSPYHKPTKKAGKFWVKPYLELFRLIRHLGSLSFDELKLYGLQLLDYRDFDKIVSKIDGFRTRKTKAKGRYKAFFYEEQQKELSKIYAEELSSGKTKIRNTRNTTEEKFLRTKAQNLRDYADACFRYLRATGLVNISKSGKSISIIPEKQDEVDYFLKSVKREPCFVDNYKKYVNYLSDTSIPALMTDDVNAVVSHLQSDFPEIQIPEEASTEQLKDLLYDCIDEKRRRIINQRISELKERRLYDDIEDVFSRIKNNSLFDPALMFEWNVWRAMTMIDGGEIKANLRFDDFGNPLSAAPGNMADIVCDYGNFGLTVEVTLSNGQRQYESENVPVARHLAKYKESINKPSYCLFIAPTINPAALVYFYYLHRIPCSYYNGVAQIIPMELSVFRKMLEDSLKVDYIPSENQMRAFFEKATEIANSAENETLWYNEIKDLALHWLT